ncbi:phosphatase PAP2 family protein [Streptomyces sp. NPDC029526]|uniref:phosphatase PAP2 family protein n=1 Tax=Streptomyces sp. NPDC029526 TaxID=3155728 RepID=UPI003410C4AB
MGDTTVTAPNGRTSAAPRPVGDRTGRAFLRRMRRPRRPRLWFEILLIAVSYWTYSLVRNAVPEQKAQALRNADWIWEVQQNLGIAVEQSVNHAVNSVTWLVVGMNYYYATLHFVVTLGVLVWLYRGHPGRYAATRLVLFATTGVALVGYYLFPLAPPRLMNGGGFIDTVMVHQTWGSMASGNLKNMSNQYAAMPSMHIGWSVWCGLTIFALASVPWVRVLGLLYPALTLVVIVATANHFWLDAVGGVLCLAFGYAVARLWYGSGPYALPRQVADRRPGRTGEGTGAGSAAAPAAPAVVAQAARTTADAAPPSTGASEDTAGAEDTGRGTGSAAGGSGTDTGEGTGRPGTASEADALSGTGRSTP